MARKDEKPTANKDPRDCPTAWFAVLERARMDGDFERAAEAIRQLRRLGVTVRFERRKAKGCAHD